MQRPQRKGESREVYVHAWMDSHALDQVGIGLFHEFAQREEKRDGALCLKLCASVPPPGWLPCMSRRRSTFPQWQGFIMGSSQVRQPGGKSCLRGSQQSFGTQQRRICLSPKPRRPPKPMPLRRRHRPRGSRRGRLAILETAMLPSSVGNLGGSNGWQVCFKESGIVHKGSVSRLTPKEPGFQ